MNERLSKFVFVAFNGWLGSLQREWPADTAVVTQWRQTATVLVLPADPLFSSVLLFLYQKIRSLFETLIYLAREIEDYVLLAMQSNRNDSIQEIRTFII